MKPTKSYIIWTSQRTGSTVLCKLLEGTGIAGRPDEWLHEYETYDLLAKYGLPDPPSLQQKLWELGTTPNGVFGLKVGVCEPHTSRMTDYFREFPGCPEGDVPRATIWENAFPNCSHIFMTRRNRVRLAVSWWKAIRSGEFHREVGIDPGKGIDPNEYNFDAIKHLILDADMREAGTQEFFEEADIVPLNIVYEDFIADYETTVSLILDFLEIPGKDSVSIPAMSYQKLADDLSEEWVQRFRRELQLDWKYKGWGWPE